MGNVIRSIISPVGNLIFNHHNRHNQEQPSAPDNSAAMAQQQLAHQQQVNEYQSALKRQQDEIASEHGKRASELEAVTKRTQEGMMRSNRARRQGGIFTEAQTTNQQPSGGSLG
jgi:hypothetical protein